MPDRPSQLPVIAAGTALAAMPAAYFALTILAPAHDHVIMAPTRHFYIVSAVALASLGLAVAASIAAVRAAEARLLMLALSFISVAGFFSVHGLATPGFIVGKEYTAVVGFSARMALLGGAVFLAASAVTWPERLARRVEEHAAAVPLAWGAALAVYFVAALVMPESIPPRLMSEQLFLDGTLAIVLAATAFSAWRYLRTYRSSDLPLHAAAAFASVLLFEAQVAMHYGQAWHAGWWVYHLQLLVAYLAILGGLALEVSRGSSVSSALGTMALPAALAQIEASYPPVVRALAATLEARDPYTHGHGRRVAALACYAGLELGLSPRRLRGMVQGALLHDVGKIGVPDHVLLKAGRHSPAEFEAIKRHPGDGERLLLAAMPGGVERGVVRHHHEWYDGRGYPDGLAGDDIPFEARIVAVADVYDALRSNRAYRAPWSREETVQLLEREAGTHFDPACTEAVLRVIDRFEAEFAPETAERQQTLEELRFRAA